MYWSIALTSLSLLAVVRGQQVGTYQTETHPSLPMQTCTSSGCTSVATKIVIDANWRWVHTTTAGAYTNCYTGNTWDATLCPDDITCAKNCALEGADYSATYGITTSGNALTLKFVTPNSSGKNIGSRVYLMASDTAYQMFKLKNKEFTFDVDVSNLPCGLNGALYFSQMDADGGLSRFTGNKAGARYGTGYCDAQCPHDMKFINGEGNAEGWVPSTNDANAGKGTYGTCCPEMDIWEANKMAAAYTPHPCTVTQQTRCSGTDCGDGDNRYGGVCDKDGCDFNSWRMGDQTFLGPGKTIDTNSKFTVVTQFITSTGTATGTLSEIRRLYVQNGKVIQNSSTNFSGITATNSISTTFCTQQKTLFGDTNSFSSKGGLTSMGDSFDKGVVLALSIWDDHDANALWLDSNYPVSGDAAKPGISRGPCATTSGVPAEVEVLVPDSSVTYSNIKFGDIGTTYTGTATTTGGSGTTTSPPTSTGCQSPKYGQCGGSTWTGCTACVSGSTCTSANPSINQELQKTNANSVERERSNCQVYEKLDRDADEWVPLRRDAEQNRLSRSLSAPSASILTLKYTAKASFPTSAGARQSLRLALLVTRTLTARDFTSPITSSVGTRHKEIEDVIKGTDE